MSAAECRACLATNATEYLDMDTLLSCGKVSYLQFFNQCTQLQIQLDDNLPRTLCNICSNDLAAAYMFVQTAVQSNTTLLTELKINTELCDKSNLCIKNEVLEIPATEEDNEFFIDCCVVDASGEEYFMEETVSEPEFLDENIAEELAEFQDEVALIEEEYFPEDEIDDDYLIEHDENMPESIGKKWRCTKCERVLHGDVSYVGHMNMHNDKRPYLCVQCRCAFRCKSVLLKHISKRHQQKGIINRISPVPLATAIEKYETVLLNDENYCKLCDAQILENNLQKHMLMHKQKEIEADKKFLCSYCPRQLKNTKALWQHERTHIGAVPDVVYMCEDCDRHYATQFLLDQHRKQAHIEREHICAICGNAFKLKNQLVSHMKLHLEKNLQCPHCEKRYARHFDLNVHLRSHTGELPFACHLCDRRFAIKVRLTYHLQKHYGVKHRCRECGSEFNSKQKLKAHSFKHTGMPYRCTFCNSRGFANRDVFKRHLLRVHNTTMADEELVAMFRRNTGKTTKIFEVQNVDELIVNGVLDGPLTKKQKHTECNEIIKSEQIYIE